LHVPAWHIVTGEYPPAPGGVSDYARSLAGALAGAGDRVHVWAPSQSAPLAECPGVCLHPLPGGYDPRGLAALSKAFSREPSPRRVLLQYVPQGFGLKGMNVPFCVWVAGLRDAEVWVMFHEVAVPWAPLVHWKQNTVAVATRLMARLLLGRADRVLVSIPAWEVMLRRLSPSWRGAMWLPIPSNIPTGAAPGAASVVRSRLSISADQRIVGHFGTYGSLIAPALKRVIRELLRSDPRRVALLVGRGSEEVARDLSCEPIAPGRVVASGPLEPAKVAISSSSHTPTA
jgi:hypothetical protein